MAGHYVTINHRQRNHRHHRMGTIHGRSPQVESTNQTVGLSHSGAAEAIRPPQTAIRRMDTRGVGSVSYF